MRDPVAKSYRNIIRGIEVFERRRDLAPNASLRFKLLPRDPDTDMEGIALRIVGETVAVPIPVAADNTFAIPRHPRALEEDAIVVPNRRAGSMIWRTDIRTPGLPSVAGGLPNSSCCSIRREASPRYAFGPVRPARHEATAPRERRT